MGVPQNTSCRIKIPAPNLGAGDSFVIYLRVLLTGSTPYSLLLPICYKRADETYTCRRGAITMARHVPVKRISAISISYPRGRTTAGRRCAIMQQPACGSIGLSRQSQNPLKSTIIEKKRFELAAVYTLFSEKDLARMDEDERHAVQTEIPVSLYDDFRVQVKDIFYDIDFP